MIGLLKCSDFSCESIAAKLKRHKALYRRPQMSPFFEAVTLGSLSSVKDLLASGVDANIREISNEASALDVAVLMGHLEVARTLVEHGVVVNGANSLGETALHVAARHNRAHGDVIDLLLCAGANIDARTTHGSTALHYAALLSDAACSDAVDILVQRGATKDAVNIDRNSPLHFAARYGNLVAIRALLAAGADATLRIQDETVAPLNVAAQHGQIKVIKELVRHGVDVDAAPEANGFTSLHHAAWKNQADAVDALVEAGASITVQTVGIGSTPLHVAAGHLALKAARALLWHGAPVLRAWRGDRGVDLSSKPPIHSAANKAGTQGAAEVVDLLLRWGADECELDNDGKTAAEVLGASVPEEDSLVEDADRVRELLANAPADRAWRRRGLLLLCLARDPRAKTRSIITGGTGVERKESEPGAEQGAEQGQEQKADEGSRAKDGDDGARGGGGGGGGGSAISSRDDDVQVSAAVKTEGQEKCEISPSKATRFGEGKGGGDNGGGRRAGGNSESGGSLDGVVASLLEFEEEGFFRTIVTYL